MLQTSVCKEVTDDLKDRRIAQLETQLARRDARITQLIREVRELKAEQNGRDEQFSTALKVLKRDQTHKPPSQYPAYEKERKKPSLRTATQKGT